MTIHKNAESIYMDEKIQECLSASDFDFYLTGSQSYEVRTNRDSEFYVSGAHLEKVQEFLTSCGFYKVYMKDYLEDPPIHSVWRVITGSDWKKIATDVQIILPQFMSRKHQVNALMIATKGMGQENYDKLSRNKAWFALRNMPLDILAHPSALS